MMVEQAGLGHHEGPDAGSGHRCAAASPLSKRRSGISDVRPAKSGLQRTRHLEPNRRDHDAVGLPLANRMNRDAEALRGLDCPAYADNPQIKSRHRKPGHFNQLVCRLKGIDDGGQAQIKDAVESKDIDAGRQSHLSGPIAKALMTQAPNLLAPSPVIERMEVLGAKLPG